MSSPTGLRIFLYSRASLIKAHGYSYLNQDLWISGLLLTAIEPKWPYWSYHRQHPHCEDYKLQFYYCALPSQARYSLILCWPVCELPDALEWVAETRRHDECRDCTAVNGTRDGWTYTHQAYKRPNLSCREEWLGCYWLHTTAFHNTSIIRSLTQAARPSEQRPFWFPWHKLTVRQ